MKLFISADMEGATGVATVSHVSPMETPWGLPGDYDKHRRLWNGDINAMIEGALQAGATDILVGDGHYTRSNIDPELINPVARYVSGFFKEYDQMGGIDETFDAAFLLAHSRVGTQQGTLCHSLMAREIHDVTINGQPAGELSFNAALAGCYGVPVALVVGDLATTKEATQLLGSVVTVSTKEAIDRFATICLTPQKTHQLIRQGAEEAAKKAKSFKPFTYKTPVKMEIEFNGVTMATVATLIPGVKRESSFKISYVADDFKTIYKLAFAIEILIEFNPMLATAFG